MEHVSNAQILANLETVHDMIRYGRLRWLGHLARQEDTRLPKRILHSRLPSKASRGRPPKCWTDYVREDLEALRLLLNWSRFDGLCAAKVTAGSCIHTRSPGF